MADLKISELTNLTAADPANDMIPIVDVSATPPASGTTKRISINNILACSPSATLASATITGNLTVDTNTLFVDAANNCVGIGTTTPTVYANYKTLALVGGSSGGVIDVHAAGGGTAGGLQVAATPTGTNFDVFGPNAGAAAPAVIRTGTFGSVSERYRIAGDGVATWSNVGGSSGTAMTLNATGLGVGVSPSYKLDVNGVINTSSDIYALGGRFALYRSAGSSYIDWSSGQSLILRTVTSVGGAGPSTIATIDSSGNVGIGVTPSAWAAASKAIDVDSYGANYAIAAATQVGISRNCYYNGTNWIYKLTTSAQRFEQDNGGGFKWFTAAAGTAGNAITLTQAMTLSDTGQLLLGTSSTNGAVDIGMVMNKPSATGFVGNVYQLSGVDKAFAYIASAASAYTTETVSGYIIKAVSATNGVYLPNGGTSWLALSDERFKDIIEPISNAVAKVGSLRSVIGKFKTESEGTRRSFLIAQDVQAVLPEAVDASNPDQLGVAYTEVIPLLVAAINELTARVQTLETR